MQLSASLNESDILAYLHSKGLLADPKPVPLTTGTTAAAKNQATFPHSEYVRFYLIDNRMCLSVIEWEEPSSAPVVDERSTLKKRRTQAVFILR